VNSWNVRTESKKRSKGFTKLQIGDFVLDHVEAPKKSFSPGAISGGPVLKYRRLSSEYTQAGRSVRVYESLCNGTSKIVFRLYLWQCIHVLWYLFNRFHFFPSPFVRLKNTDIDVSSNVAESIIDRDQCIVN